MGGSSSTPPWYLTNLMAVTEPMFHCMLQYNVDVIPGISRLDYQFLRPRRSGTILLLSVCRSRTPLGAFGQLGLQALPPTKLPTEDIDHPEMKAIGRLLLFAEMLTR